MGTLMTHLVANYPDPEKFSAAFRATLDQNVDFLEIQFPFTNPVADGEAIYEANQVAVKFAHNLSQVLETCHQIKENNCPESKTKLLLIAYSTSVLSGNLTNLVELLKNNGFSGLIIPDLPFGRSPEQTELNQLCQAQQLQLVPVIANNTTEERLQQIKTSLQSNQPVYAMARSGRTGTITDFDNEEIKGYFNLLQDHLQDYQVAVGFGISNNDQVKQIRRWGFIPVIGSAIVRKIKSASDSNKDIYTTVKNFLQEVSK
jgi:tryptophan synthase alpha chain